MIDFDIKKYFEMIEAKATDENGTVCYPRLYGQLQSQLDWALGCDRQREIVIKTIKEEMAEYQQQLELEI